MNGKRNSFRIMNYRLNVIDINHLILQGYFPNNKMENKKIAFFYGRKKLLSSVMENKGFDIVKKYKAFSPSVDTEYTFDVTLPKVFKPSHFIRICETDFWGVTKLVKMIRCSELIKLRNKINGHIYEPEIENDRIYINGWYVNPKESEDVDISIYDNNRNMVLYDITACYRGDVINEYSEVDNECVHGFKIEIPREANLHSLLIILKSGKKNLKFQVPVNESGALTKIKRIKKLFHSTLTFIKLFGLKKAFSRALAKISKYDDSDYNERTKHQKLTKWDIKKMQRVAYKYEPLISVVISRNNVPEEYFVDLKSSLENQIYKNWEVYISDVDLGVLNTIKGEYVVFVDSNSLLSPDALYECVRVLNKKKDIDILYSDEDKISADGKIYFEPHFKSDFNIDLLCSMNYISHMLVVKKSIIEQIDTLDSLYSGEQAYDFLLRCVDKAKHIYHIPKVLYHERVIDPNNALCCDQKPVRDYSDVERKAIQEHYGRIGIKADIQNGIAAGTYHTKYIIENEPKVSIIIPNKDHISDLKKCISSIEEKSSYQNYEYIIVENNSEEKCTFEYYEKLQKANKKVRVVYWDKEFNYSAINNYGVSYACGEYILLLNNDTSIINSDCLEELVGCCMRDDVGAVGARLYYEDNTIQHAGVIVGFGGIAGHAFSGADKDSCGYFNRIICTQDLSAVTAACMLVKKSIFQKIGGFDETLKVAFNDIDLCMRIRQLGYLVVYNPYSELYHYESKSRGIEDTKEKVKRFHGEIQSFSKKWPDILVSGDPYYNPNLSLEGKAYELK